MLMLAGSPGKKEPKELSTRQNIMSLLSLKKTIEGQNA
jgi:hypothetical protein